MAEAKPITDSSLAKDLMVAAYGVIVVHVSDESLLLDARCAFEQTAMEGSNKFGLHLTDTNTITSIHSGSERRLKMAKFMHAANTTTDSAIEPEIIVYDGKGRLNWFSVAGISLLNKHLDGTADLIICEQVIPAVTPEISDALLHLSYTAKTAKVRLVFFLVCTEAPENAGLIERADDNIVVKSCEPYAGQLAAFSIDCIGLRMLNRQGCGKTMCNVKLLDSGVFKRRYEPYIADDLDTRLMWHMSRQGRTMQEIGATFDMHKSTVSRRLQSIHTQSKTNISEEILNRQLKAWRENCANTIQDDDAEDEADKSDLHTYM